MNSRGRSTGKRNERLKADTSPVTRPKGAASELLEPESASNTLPINQIVLPSEQPRRYFDPDKQRQLELSIRHEGILQPLLVRPVGGDRFELVAGERRFRAAQAVGLAEVPVSVREMSDEQARQYALVENLQREDLNPVEETEGILQLLEIRLDQEREEIISLLNRMSKVSRGLADNVIRPEQEQTINEVFTAVGRLTPESFRVNRLPLLNLPDGILEALRAGQIEYTKAKAIAQVKDEQARVELLAGAIEQGLSLTDIKERVKALRELSSTQKAPGAEYIRKRVNQLGKLSKNSAALDDQTTRQKLDKLIAQIEKLLKG